MDRPPRPLHVLLLNQAFHPDVVATAQMGKDLADALARRGHTVTAVASRSIYGKSGAALPSRESIPVEGAAHQIDVQRVGASIFGKRGILARLADFALFYVLATIKVLAVPRPDVVVGYTTPPFIALVGLLSRALRGSRAVYWVMDLYPDTPIACGMMRPESWLARALEWIHVRLLARSDASVVLGRCMEERVLAKGVPAARVKRIPVWADLDGIEPIPHDVNPLRSPWAAPGEFLVMYSGNLGIGHDVDTILGAAKRLKDEQGVRFLFVGGGKRRAEVEAFVATHGLPNVSWREYQPREALGQSLSAADLHLISLRAGAEGVMVPSKLFGIMAAGRASIFVGSPRSEIARVLTESGSGVVIAPGDDEGLARTILDLRANPDVRASLGKNAREAIAGRYDRDTACRAWIELIEEVAGPARRG